MNTTTLTYSRYIRQPGLWRKEKKRFFKIFFWLMLLEVVSSILILWCLNPPNVWLNMFFAAVPGPFYLAFFCGLVMHLLEYVETKQRRN